MISILSAAVLALLATSTTSAIIPWDTTEEYGYVTTLSSQGDAAVTDSDVTTFTEKGLDTGARFTILTNSDDLYAGIYVQSSGDFVTDYDVRALDQNGETVAFYDVCGARSNFTYIPFIGTRGDGRTMGVNTVTIVLDARASKNGATTARINEIYPIHVGDEVFNPNNTSPCPNSS
ncbi:hypothetical protein CkaCkLH20_05880 [Colletotrichum karsti]|uniref:Uncharacterized protein n=1 Tax=Colletotrichum karsti TaxID=1095194 RepID=A0A9P6I665_9PEZI|nr:uncharacterized protein CkaCkLH20_05880 [Colletotrichum karsti]KAF9876472.1 hypothetical protein CkaCkLH20_05880 [Colletotrichum karsti]